MAAAVEVVATVAANSEIETETYEIVTGTANFEILAMRLPSAAIWIGTGVAGTATLIPENHEWGLAEADRDPQHATSAT